MITAKAGNSGFSALLIKQSHYYIERKRGNKIPNIIDFHYLYDSIQDAQTN